MPEQPLSRKDKIAVLEKQIDRLRKEGDDRMSSNHTLWRAGLAGIGALVLLKGDLEQARLVLLLALLSMVFASHWLNVMFMFCRAGDAMASCEANINVLAGEQLLDHESTLAHGRAKVLRSPVLRCSIVAAALILSAVSFLVIWHVKPDASAIEALYLWRVGGAAAMLANAVAVVNLWRILSFNWPSQAPPEGNIDKPI